MRLTEKSNQGYIYKTPCPDGLGFVVYDEYPIQKLGQYEDIDENPEHLAKIKKALEIIKEKDILVQLIQMSKDLNQYNELIYEENKLTQEEYDLLKEVLL